VGGGAEAAVFEFTFAEGRLHAGRTFPIVEPQKRTADDFVGDVALSPDGRLIYAAELFRNTIAVVNPQSGMVIGRFQTGRRPYRILFHPDGASLFVSSWADGSVFRHEAAKGKLIERIRVALHPTDMLWAPGAPKTEPGEDPSPYVARIFVAASNTNTVHVLGITAANDVRPAEVINVAMTPRQPAGMTPSALGFDAGRNWLYVACSDANAVTIIDVSGGRSRVLGMLPAGWYPTAVRSLGDGKLAVINARGSGGDPAGSVSLVQVFGGEELDAATRAVFVNSPYRDDLLDNAGGPNGNPAPSRAGGAPPIEHVFYLIKGNLAYDQVFGGWKAERGDASLASHEDHILANHHKLARQFVLLDNFYAIGEAGAEGLQWSVASIASDFVAKLAPAARAGRVRGRDFGEGEPAAAPPAGYLWGSARLAGVAVKTYAQQVPDLEQAGALLRDLREMSGTGRMPRLVIVPLGGAQAGDNDRALGMIVEAVSRSPIWSKSVIFAAESGAAPGGKDPISRRHAPALVISPYARRGAIDSTFYNTASLLRTIELILGLRPLTQFDAAARPMWSCFQTQPDLAAYTAAAH